MYHDITVVGRVGRDAEMRYTQSGKAVTSFSVAENTKRGGEKITTWFQVSAWNKLAEICNEHVKKGDLILVAGYLNSDKETGGPRIWEGKDGKSKAQFELTATSVRFLSTKERKESQDEMPF